MKSILVLSLLLASQSVHSFGPNFGKIYTPEEMQKIRQQQVARQQEDMKKIMRDCHEHTKGKDVNGRAIVPEVLKGMGDTCTATPKPSQNLQSFMNDINKTMRTFDDRKIWDEASAIALDKSVRAILSLHHRFVKLDKPMSPGQMKLLVCKNLKEVCKVGYKGPEGQMINKSIQQFIADQKTKPIRYLDGVEQEKLKLQFNHFVEQANKTCEMTKKKYQEIKDHYSCAPKFNFNCINIKKDPNWKKPADCDKKPEMMSETKCMMLQDEAYAKHKRLESLAYQSIMINQQMVMGTELAPLLASKKFRDHVGMGKPDFVYESCMKGNGKVINPVWQKQINDARGDLYNMAFAELSLIEKKRLTPDASLNEANEIKKYLKTNPMTIADLLKKNPDPNYAKAVCSYVKSIHWDDKLDHIIDGTLIGMGVVAGLAFTIATGGMGLAVTGPVATSLAAISIGSTAISITKNQVDAHNLINENQRIAQAMVTQQKGLDEGIANIKTNEEKIDFLNSSAKWGTAGLVLEVVGLGFARHAALAKVGTLKKTPALYKLVDGADDAKKAEKLAIGSRNFTKAVESLGQGKAGLVKNLDEAQQTKLAALFSKLDEANGKLIAQQMANLDEAGLKKFFLMIDDLGTANLDATKILARMDEFAKTGKPSRMIAATQPAEWKQFSPAITNDVRQVAKVYPESMKSLKTMLPKSTPESMRKLMEDVRAVYKGKISDPEISLMVERFGVQGAKSTDDMMKRFQKMGALRQKHATLFEKNGVLARNFPNEGEMTKLAYLDELERNGIPLRNADGEFIMAADGRTILRKKISNLSPAQKLDEIKKEFSYISSSGPCTL